MNERPPRLLLGSLGQLAIFAWTLGLVLLSTPSLEGILLIGAVLLALTALHPSALVRLLNPRWLILLALLFGITVAFGQGEPDIQALGVPLSRDNLLSGLLMVLRALAILMAADGFSKSVNISEVAGLFERGGMKGLGFSLGVAVNLLPALREASANAWHSLWMRGGLRARWGRGLQLLALTVLTNALRRADAIVLAAEARAFRPELSRRMPLRVGRLDWAVIGMGVACLAGAIVLL